MADDPVLREAKERFEESQEGSEYNRNAAEEDIRFARLGEQWPDEIEQLRKAENRPCLTINKMPSFIRQVVNDARQNKPSITVSPVDNGADEDTAEVINGIIRSIERGSSADVAYDTAIDHAVSGGFGFFRIGIDYAHDQTFNLECKIHRVPNPLMVHWDVSSTEFDASDWDYAFVSDFLTEDQFEAKYPKAEKVSFESADNREMLQYWLDGDKTRIAEYWHRTYEQKKLLLLSSGESIREDRIPEIARTIAEQMGIDASNESDDDLRAQFFETLGVQPTRERVIDTPLVTRRVISGAEVLEEEEWPGSTIPICPVWGEEVAIDGRRHFRSMTRDARDPQMMFNFWRSASTELVALAPRAPFVGEQGFVPPGHETKWGTANTRSHAYLEYSRGMNPPQRQGFAGVPAGALQESLNANDDMKSIIGIYDASLGARSNETSGRAILARQRESDVSNFHFIDNLSRAIRYAGKCLVEIIPYVYSDREVMRILGEDMHDEVVRLTTSNATAGEGEKLYDLTVGKYDVDVKSGPSYATQREETRETLIEIMRAVPGAAQFIGDILMDHLDFQGADKVAKRLQMLLPPQIQQSEGIGMPIDPGAMPGQAGLPQGQPPLGQSPASAPLNGGGRPV